MDEYRAQKVLITGGLGFIGSNLAHRLVQLGASVTLLDSIHPTCGGNRFNVEQIKNDVEVVVGNSCDFELVRKLIRGTAYIFNLAGHVSHIESMQEPFEDLQMNAVAPLTVLEACKVENREARIVYSGTRQSYGRPDTVPLVETQLLKPVDVNGVNKMAGEWFHMVYHRAYGIPAVSLRLINTYGPRQLVKHARQGFVGWFIKQAIDGEEIQVFGDGQQVRGFNYVDDVVDALLIAGVNDTDDQAHQLAAQARRLAAKVNLIPYNTVQGLSWSRPSRNRQEKVLSILHKHAIPATLRREKGGDIDAACGQLRLQTKREELGVV